MFNYRKFTRKTGKLVDTLPKRVYLCRWTGYEFLKNVFDSFKNRVYNFTIYLAA